MAHDSCSSIFEVDSVDLALIGNSDTLGCNAIRFRLWELKFPRFDGTIVASTGSRPTKSNEKFIVALLSLETNIPNEIESMCFNNFLGLDEWCRFITAVFLSDL